ncbi:MAG: heavy-metal-associated domain-containing protein [Firmicutes bacterium]|nr:heavy-metal-associated domain-containing protein [Bacillota bacterium]
MSIEISTLKVMGMSCIHCENSVKKSVSALNGVSNVLVSLIDKKVTIEYDSEKVDIKTIKERIQDLDYEVEYS